MAKDLRELKLETRALFQYVVGLIICSPTKEDSSENTILTLNFLRKKAIRFPHQRYKSLYKELNMYDVF